MSILDRRRAVPLLAALCVVLPVLVAAGPSTPVTADERSLCTSALVVGVRGSGESATSGTPRGVGDRVGAAIQGFKEAYKGDTDVVALALPLAYPAAPVSDVLLSWNSRAFRNSISAGARSLVTLLDVRDLYCKDQPIVLFGYSQGALVINEALWALRATPRIVNRIEAIGLLADPVRMGGSSYVTGGADPRLNGIAVTLRTTDRRALPTGLAAVAESRCVAADAVCATPGLIVRGGVVQTGTAVARALGAAFVAHTGDAYKGAAASALGRRAAAKVRVTSAPKVGVVEQSGSRGSPTFRDPTNASGPGPRIPAMSQVTVSCRVHAPQIASANPDGWWYRIASPPWDGTYYAVANTFWNGDVPGRTPYVHNTDFAVPVC